jgi:pSer/pThr/pTyr-binding forkhead associated (FHA) protein
LLAREAESVQEGLVVPFTHLRREEVDMDPSITFTVVEGNLDDTQFSLHCRGRFIVGRGRDCDIVLRGNNLESLSRHQCRLIVDESSVAVRDLGSRNGTYVNGECIGCRLDERPSSDIETDSYVTFELNDGDDIQIGHLALRIAIDSFEEATDSPLMRGSSHVHSTI